MNGQAVRIMLTPPQKTFQSRCDKRSRISKKPLRRCSNF